jgi:hypothetical protein
MLERYRHCVGVKESLKNSVQTLTSKNAAASNARKTAPLPHSLQKPQTTMIKSSLFELHTTA